MPAPGQHSVPTGKVPWRVYGAVSFSLLIAPSNSSDDVNLSTIERPYLFLPPVARHKRSSCVLVDGMKEERGFVTRESERRDKWSSSIVL